MAGRLPRLRVDSPYPGESMTSFLGRAAQFYCQPVSSLLLQLTRCPAQQHGRPDLDRWPSDELLAALEEALDGWQSPLAGFVGFRNWVLSPTVRHAYCPTCFKEDLAMQRVPYFRLDWITVLTTSCWNHGTPLCQWKWASRHGRRLPRAWVFQKAFDDETYPEFFRSDLNRLRALQEGQQAFNQSPDLGCAMGLLRRLQQVLEKPAATSMPDDPNSEVGGILEVSLHRLSLLAVTFDRKAKPTGPPAAYLQPHEFGDWFGPHPLWFRPREHEYRENALRLAGDVAWRRTYLWFVARTLAGCEPFASSLFRDFQPWEPWEAWWDRDVRRLCPEHFQESIDFEAKMLRGWLARR